MIRIITDNLLYMGISAAVFSLLLLVITWVSRRRLSSRLYLAGWITALVMLVLPAYAVASMAGFSFSGVFGNSASNSQAAQYRAAYTKYMEKSVFPMAKDETTESLPKTVVQFSVEEGTAAVTGQMNNANASLPADNNAVNADGIEPNTSADKPAQQDVEASTFAVELSPVDVVSNTAETPAANALSLRNVIFAVWALGVIVIGGLKFLRYFRFRKMILTNSVPGDEQWMDLLPENIRGNLKIREAKVPSPVVFGIIHPTVVIPKRDLSDASMRYALMHEGLHILRKDLLLRTAAEAAAVLNWINPFAWLIRNKVTQYSENTCDEEVVTDLSKEERQKYAMSILDFMETSDEPDPAYPATLMSFSGEAEHVRRRMKHIMEFKTMRRRAVILSCCVVAAAALIGVLAACSLAFPGSTDAADESGVETGTESTGPADTVATSVASIDSSETSETSVPSVTPAAVDMSVFAIAPTYDYASEFSADGYAIVTYSAGPDTVYSFIDMEGNEVPQVFFENFIQGPLYYWKEYGDFGANGFVWIERDGLWGFVNRKCEVVVEPKYDGAMPFSADGIAGFKMNGKWGFINETGKIVIEPQFDGVDIFRENGLCNFEENGKYGLIDKDGRIVADALYDSIFFEGECYEWGGFFEDNGTGVAAVCVDEKWGLINSEGKVLAKPVYDDFFIFGTNGLAAVQRDGKYGYINTEGKLAIDCQFEDASYIFSDDGTAYVCMDGKYGFINEQGEIIIEPQYDSANMFDANGLAAVCVDDKWGFIDTVGQYVVAPQYEYTYGFDDLGLAVVVKDGLSGLIDETGRYVIEPIYQDIYSTSVPDAYYASMPEGLDGMINSAGETLIPQEYTYLTLPCFTSDEGPDLINHTPITAVLVYKGDKAGIVSIDGKVLVPIISEGSLVISPTGMVSVEYNGKYGYIQIKE